MVRSLLRAVPLLLAGFCLMRRILSQPESKAQDPGGA